MEPVARKIRKTALGFLASAMSNETNAVAFPLSRSFARIQKAVKRVRDHGNLPLLLYLGTNIALENVMVTGQAG